jgi:hypothetical protein
MDLEEVDLHDPFTLFEQPAHGAQAPQTEVDGLTTGAL